MDDFLTEIKNYKTNDFNEFKRITDKYNNLTNKYYNAWKISSSYNFMTQGILL